MDDAKLSKSDFEEALKLLGSLLPKPMKVWVVGGGALVLGYDLNRQTGDLDCVLRLGSRSRLEEVIGLIATKLELPEDWMNFKFEEFNYEINTLNKNDFQKIETFGMLTVCYASLELILATKCSDARMTGFREEDFQDITFCIQNLGLKTLDEVYEVVESKNLIDTLSDNEARILETHLRGILGTSEHVASSEDAISSLGKLTADELGNTLKKAVATELTNLLHLGPNDRWVICDCCNKYTKVEAGPEYLHKPCNYCGRESLIPVTAPSKECLISTIIAKVNIWCKKWYSTLGEGSARIVYKLDEDHALKLAYGERGTAQNKAESRMATKYHDLPITKVHFIDPLGLFLVVDFAHELKDETFEAKYKISFDLFSTLCLQLSNCAHIKNPKRQKSFLSDTFKKFSPESRGLLRDLMKHHLMPGDLDRREQWGEVADDPVLVDYGFTRHVWQTYYR